MIIENAENTKRGDDLKNKNLKRLSGISQDICNKMIAYQSQDKDIVIMPKTFLDSWQRELFRIVADETKDINH